MKTDNTQVTEDNQQVTQKEILQAVTAVYDTVTHKRVLKVTKKVIHKSESKVKPHSKLNNYYEPTFRGCAFPIDTNMNRKDGKANPHPLKMNSFKKQKGHHKGDKGHATKAVMSRYLNAN